MPIRRYKPERIVTVLRQIEVAAANWTASPFGEWGKCGRIRVMRITAPV